MKTTDKTTEQIFADMSDAELQDAQTELNARLSLHSCKGWRNDALKSAQRKLTAEINKRK